MEKKRFMALMNELALGLRKYAPDFTDIATLQTWYADLGDIPEKALIDACLFARRNLDEFPSIAWIRRKCKGTTRSDTEIGRDIASRIETAMSSYGYTNPSTAEEYIGEIGWEVVRQCGGWQNICNIESMSEMPSHRKQWREIGEIVSKNYHEGGKNFAPSLPMAGFSAAQFIERLARSEQ